MIDPSSKQESGTPNSFAAPDQRCMSDGIGCLREECHWPDQPCVVDDLTSEEAAAFAEGEADLAAGRVRDFAAPVHEWWGSDVARFARAWDGLPPEVREAITVCREYEEEGAYNPTILADPVRGFFRQSGGAAEVRRA